MKTAGTPPVLHAISSTSVLRETLTWLLQETEILSHFCLILTELCCSVFRHVGKNWNAQVRSSTNPWIHFCIFFTRIQLKMQYLFKQTKTRRKSWNWNSWRSYCPKVNVRQNRGAEEITSSREDAIQVGLNSHSIGTMHLLAINILSVVVIFQKIEAWHWDGQEWTVRQQVTRDFQRNKGVSFSLVSFFDDLFRIRF